MAIANVEYHETLIEAIKADIEQKKQQEKEVPAAPVTDTEQARIAAAQARTQRVGSSIPHFKK